MERSMPPVIRTVVWPTARIRSGRRLTMRLDRFARVARSGVNGAAPTKTARLSPRTTYSDRRRSRAARRAWGS
jgi:hypothetical protein